MATLASTMVTDVLTEVRDPLGIATSRADVLSLVSVAQQQVNGILDDVIDSASFAVPAKSRLFQIFANFPAAVRILSIRDASGRDLDKMSARADEESTWIDLGWLTAIGSELRSWGTIGRDVLALRPGLSTASTVSVRYTKLTAALTSEAQTTEVPAEDDPAVRDLAALLVRLKSRDFDGLPEDLERFKATMGALKESTR